MKLARRSKAAVIGVALLIGLVIAKIMLAPSSWPGRTGPHVTCHKLLEGALMQWMQERQEKMYPNVEGDSAKSFAVLESYLGPMEDGFEDYVYVPGLQPDDPHDLVTFFVKRKSRQRWHGDNPSIFRSAKWITMGPSPEAGEGWYELSQSVDTEEMKRRLERTMRYLKEHNRPNWPEILKEQSKNLELIHD